ncbi:MAG: DUF4157 domain-containing protein [Pseudomonadota bacterium]|nr:DUF4157 domain-containing protein [Pseudomonadota bacterium]
MAFTNMFAPPVTKPKAKTAASSTNKLALERSTAVGHRHGDGGVAEALWLRAVPRGWAHSRQPEQETGPASTRAGATPPDDAWDFSKIPLFPPERMGGVQPLSPAPAPRLPGPIQAKLKVGAVNDPLEHEADRVADQVMRMPAPGVSVAAASPQLSRKCDACEEEEKLQKKPAGPQAATNEAPASVHEVLRSPGQPLDVPTRAFLEPGFGHDFSKVRVHTDAAAQVSAAAEGALAYTAGCDVVFGAGQYRPHTVAGRWLIAHELAHVIQQQGAGERGGRGRA